MQHRPWQLVTLNIHGKDPGQVIKTAELAALTAEGWTMGPNWISVTQDPPGSGQITANDLQIAMVPPSPLATLERAEREALVELVEATKTAHTEQTAAITVLGHAAPVLIEGLTALVDSSVCSAKQLAGLDAHATTMGRIAYDWADEVRAAHKVDRDRLSKLLDIHSLEQQAANLRTRAVIGVLVAVGLVQIGLLGHIASLLSTP